MNLALSALAGFLAELIDGTLGMAFGVTASTLLQATGLSPAITSATVHTAEIFIIGTNGISHLKLGNVDKQLLLRLALPGTATAMLGAYLLSTLHATWIALIIQSYLLTTGLILLLRAFGLRPLPRINPTIIGAIGGFLDAIGGGGWGTIVTGTLLAADNDPRTTVGSVNTAKFFVATSESLVFLATLKISYISYLLPFIIGGLIAAPIGAWLCKTLNKKQQRKLYILVGFLLITTNTAKLLTELIKSI